MTGTTRTIVGGRDPFVFIVGRGRSGTTLVRAMLTSHPNLAIPAETHFIVPLSLDPRINSGGGLDVSALCERLFRQPGFDHLGLDPADVRTALTERSVRTFSDAMRSLFALYARSQGKSRYGDKTPIHVLHINRLAELFPEARFIHVIRDGRDVSLSYLDVDFGAKDLWEGAIYWRRFVNEGRRAGQMLGPDRYMEVRYEDVTADPRGQLDRLCDFAGLDFRPGMLRYFEQAERVGASPNNHPNLHLPPTKGLRNWREHLSLEEAAMFEALAGDVLSELGYERTAPSPSWGTRIRARLMWLRVGMRRLLHRLRVRSLKLQKRLESA